MSYMEDNGEVQGVFRRDRRTEDNIVTLQGICALRKSKKGKIFLVFFLDLSKAFDRVWRDGLFYLLWKNGIQGVYVGNVYELFIVTSVTKFSLEILNLTGLTKNLG